MTDILIHADGKVRIRPQHHEAFESSRQKGTVQASGDTIGIGERLPTRIAPMILRQRPPYINISGQ